MASNTEFARRWTHTAALMSAAIRSGEAKASLMDVSVLGSLPVLSASAGLSHDECPVFSVTPAVRRLAPFGAAVQGTSVPFAQGVEVAYLVAQAQDQALAYLQTAAAERRGTTVLATTVPVAAALRNHKSISVDPRPVSGKGRKGGVPPRGRPDEKG
ncbi:hypothetical protein AB0I28_31265 [Phytomonospora sp. NPDC050363]|uniref:hypothetical protein n=1 Tax=Phytomonospora sp. NPDC050363 TaxID=3155642 RepID=UPI0033D09B34